MTDLLPPPPAPAGARPAATAPAPAGGLLMPPMEPDGQARLDVAELADLVGPIYADAFEGISRALCGHVIHYPDDRAARRGRQLAIVLVKLGWTDEQIIAYLGLTAGVLSDVAWLAGEIKAAKAAPPTDPAPPPEGVSA